MAKARLYAYNSDAVKNGDAKLRRYVGELKGQAKVVLDELRRNLKPRLAVEIEKTTPFFETRQERFRVVLYYILVFKSKGIISTYDPDVENEDENAFAGLIPTDEN